MTEKAAITDEELLGFAAGVLSSDEMSAMAERVAQDPTAQTTLTEWKRQDAALEALYQPVALEPVPDRLANVIRRAEAEDAMSAADRPKTRSWLFAATVAALAVGAAGGWLAHGLTPPAEESRTLAADAMRAYATYVVEVKHPVEVAASDSDHLNTWMSKRLGHEIRPPDFAAAGFTLMGGRIVPSDHGAAALYMYDNAEGQRITLYIAPLGSSNTTAFQFAEDGLTQSFFWMDKDLSYAVVGTVPRDVLRAIALAAYDQLI